MPMTLPAQMEERKAGSSLPSNCDSGWATLLESGGDLAQNSVPLIINNQSVWEQFRPSSRAAAATYANNSNMQSSAEGAHSIRDLRQFKETLINSGCLRSADAVKIAVTSSPDNYSAECVRSCAGTNVPGGTGADDWCPSNSYCNNGNPANVDAFRQGVNSNVANYNSNGKVLLEGSFGRLLDPSTTTIPCSDSMDEYPVSNMLSHPLSSKPTFHSSNILTFHSNMSKLDMAYPAPKPNHQKSGGSASDSSSASNSSNNALQKSSVDEGGESTTEQKRNAHQVGPLGNNAFKKPRTEPSPMKVQVRKEKLGERITALQQLVSPFGKTDTASVLLEAMGYIKFLQEQVQVLSTPYLKGLPVSSQIDGIRGDEAKYDLRSRGLCLVPVSCTLHVANNNGADFWTSGIGSSSKI